MAEARSVNPQVREKIDELLQALDDHMDISEIRPIRDRILCKPLEKGRTEKKGDLYVVRDREKQPRIHLVIDWGSSVDLDLSPGDLIVTGKHTGMPYKRNQDYVRFIKAGNVLGVYKGGSPENFEVVRP